MEVDDDPTPEEQAASEAPMATYLILGRSNTGKVRTHTLRSTHCTSTTNDNYCLQSNLVRALLKQYEAYQLPTLICNDRSRNCPYTRVEWHQLGQIRSCALIIEGVCVCCAHTVVHYNVRTFFHRCHVCIYETISASTHIHYLTLRLKLLL
jgi:hypothetical protein